MKKQSFESHLALIIDAVEKASPTDSSLGIGSTNKGDGLDLLVDAIEDLLRRSRESLRTFQSAQRAILELQIPDDSSAKEDLSREHILLLDALQANMPDTIYFKDAKSRFLHLSKAHAKAFNLVGKEEVIGKTDFDFFTKEHAQEAFEDEQRIIRTGMPIINKEEKETWPDRPATWVLTTKMPLRDSQGAIAGTFGISRDITERKRVEEALRQSEEKYRISENKYRNLIEVAPEGISVVENAKVIFFNNHLLEMLGYSHEEMMGLEIAQIIHKDDVGQALERYAARAEGKLIPTAVFRDVRKDGKVIWVETVGRNIEWEGRPAVLYFSSDITERKTLEERFAQSQKMEAIGQLTGGIAHDFNNVLQVITGYCELLTAGLSDENQRYAEEITKAAERATMLTAQLLAFSRKQVLSPQVLETKELIRSVQKMLERVIGEDIELQTFIDPNTGNFLADRGQMEQVLLNLAVNARDAMPSGGKLTIETANRTIDEAYVHDHPGAKTGQYVRIAVSDTGVGMGPETLSHIYEPFFTTKEMGKGTGLGLSTVYGIVKQSEGYINCYSEMGKGTTFTVYFPLTSEEAPTPLLAASGATAPRGTETILIVDDDQAVRNVTRIALENAGYVVIEASGGGEALTAVLARGATIDLLVSDVVMPRMSGKELARRLREIFPKVRVLYASGYTGNVISRHGILEAGLDFLQKPFSSTELLAKVREILDRA